MSKEQRKNFSFIVVGRKSGKNVNNFTDFSFILKIALHEELG